SFAYIHATEVGGTHPALIEAMGRGAMVLFLSNPEDHEVAGDAGIPFEFSNLVDKLKLAASLTEAERTELGRRAIQRVADLYSWDAVTDQYESLLTKLARR